MKYVSFNCQVIVDYSSVEKLSGVSPEDSSGVSPEGSSGDLLVMTNSHAVHHVVIDVESYLV